MSGWPTTKSSGARSLTGSRVTWKVQTKEKAMATMTEHAVLNEGMSEGLRMQVSKVIRASREQVFEAWTKPDVIQRWFGPANMDAAKATNDLRVGGTYRIEMRAWEGGGEKKAMRGG